MIFVTTYALFIKGGGLMAITQMPNMSSAAYKWGDLRGRIIVAVPLLAVVALMIIWQSAWQVGIVVALLAVVGETGYIIDTNRYHWRVVAVGFVAVVGLLAAHDCYLRSKALVIIILAVVIASDLGAYGFGRMFGRNHFSVHSPNKTVEGLIGGVALAVLAGWLMLWATGHGVSMNRLGLLGAISLFSMWGDLFESRMKRTVGIKDSSRLLGPHGGLLDRLDSISWAFVAGWLLMSFLV